MVCSDAHILHGVAGAYSHIIFVEARGAKESSLLNCVSKEDFGGDHPNPNLTYAKKFVTVMRLVTSKPQTKPPKFGVVADGATDLTMILGAAMSIPTLASLVVVAKHLYLQFCASPMGWNFFRNLLGTGICSVCGEASFGTDSDHGRENDDIWIVLTWVSILACQNMDNLDRNYLVTFKDIVYVLSTWPIRVLDWGTVTATDSSQKCYIIYPCLQIFSCLAPGLEVFACCNNISTRPARMLLLLHLLPCYFGNSSCWQVFDLEAAVREVELPIDSVFFFAEVAAVSDNSTTDFEQGLVLEIRKSPIVDSDTVGSTSPCTVSAILAST